VTGKTAMQTSKIKSVAERIRRRDFMVAPGVFDMISAKIADGFGFGALYMTGYGVTASYLGLPDAGLTTYTDMHGRAATIAAGTATPLIADADTGYGGLLNVRHTVRGYEAAGIAAIQIEDQEYPKKCGHTPGRRVIPAGDMVRKIEVAVDSRSSADFLIIARTDARTTLGLDEALRRGEAYAKAGADIVFIESPESEAELAQIGRSFDVPLLVNNVEGGRTPILPPARLKELGFTLAIYPTAGFLAAGAALRGIYGDLRDNGTSLGASVPLDSFAAFSKLMGFEDVWAFERRWAETPPIDRS
jgi:2-methylisocitrate lyase-like PEP mutase family enzyme